MFIKFHRVKNVQKIYTKLLNKNNYVQKKRTNNKLNKKQNKLLAGKES